MTSFLSPIPFQTAPALRCGRRSWSVESIARKTFFVVPLTSKTDRLLDGEFSLADWQGAGLNVASVVKRGLYTIHESLVIQLVGRLVSDDASRVDAALRRWLDL
jgi:mRNA interferase MazF